MIKTHHYIIFFVRPLHSKPGMKVIVDQVQTNTMAGLWCYIQSSVTELLIMRYPHCGRMCLSQLKPSELYILSFGKGLGFFSKLRM